MCGRAKLEGDISEIKIAFRCLPTTRPRTSPPVFLSSSEANAKRYYDDLIALSSINTRFPASVNWMNSAIPPCVDCALYR